MNTEHALAILRELSDWYERAETGPSASALLFDDVETLRQHIEAALGGIPLSGCKRG